MIPAQATDVADRLRDLLRDALVGVYLHGSFALGCGNPNRTDLDLLVVTRRALSERERVAFADLQLHPWRHPAPFDLHLATLRLVGPGHDRDLAAHVTVAQRAGIALAGPPPAQVFPDVPRSDDVDAPARLRRRLMAGFRGIRTNGRSRSA